MVMMATYLNVTLQLAETGQLGEWVDDDACEVHLHRVVLQLLVRLSVIV